MKCAVHDEEGRRAVYLIHSLGRELVGGKHLKSVYGHTASAAQDLQLGLPYFW